MQPSSDPDPLRFEPLHHADRVQVVNPLGDVGLITLWTPLKAVRRKLDAEAPALLGEDSRLAVVANLYGDGMYAMFCNLLYNPQVRHLVAIGQGLGLPTTDELRAFLAAGLEDDEQFGRPVSRVAGTDRVFPRDPAFDADALRERLTFVELGGLSQDDFAGALSSTVAGLPTERTTAPRVRVELEPPTQAVRMQRPSDVGAHHVGRTSPLDCWEELVVRCVRFGRLAETDGGRRIELLNVRAVIAKPEPDDAAALAPFGFDREALDRYAAKMFDPTLPADTSYSYGNRLLEHFGTPDSSGDTVERIVQQLERSPHSRRAYVSLWDTRIDLAPDAGSVPCLVSLYVRRVDAGLTATAVYRAHNLLDAWLPNAYGLMALQRHIATAVGLDVGPLTVISESLGINPASTRYGLAESVAERWTSDDDIDHATGKRSLREDPSGYFVVSADREAGRLIADHRYGGMLVKRYTGARPEAIEAQVAADMAITLPSHAMWLGRELTRKAALLRD